MIVRISTIAVALGALAFGCTRVQRVPNPDHCTRNEGDQYCAELDPSRPFCTHGDTPCDLGGFTGCVEEVTLECHAPCGTLPEDECFGEGSSGTDTGSGSGSGSESGESGSSTTGPMPCVGNEDCMDGVAPFCDPDTGECVRCDATADPDGSCAELDPGMPLCVEGVCVACTPENPVVCDDQLLLCDGDTNACVPCTEHGRCVSGACELAMGRCFPEDFVVHVDGDGGQDYTSIAAAVGDVDDGLYGVIVVHELDGAAPYTTAGGLTIGGGKTIALLAAPGEAPIVQGTGINPGLRVEVAGTTVYADGLTVSNGSAQGLVVDEAFAWVDRSRIVGNDGGGILAQNAAELTVRNCFVGGSDNNVAALDVDGASANIVYSSLTSGFAAATALMCNAPVDVSARNSILLVGAASDAVSCPGAMLVDSATEDVVGAFDGSQNWFVDYFGGDLALSAAGATVFADIARWQTGDPATDIDGDPRPTTDGAMDYAGADAVP